MRKKLRIAVPLALGALTVGLLMASSASAIHPTPQGATPIRVPLVPAMKECPYPGNGPGSHNGPLPLPSCNNPDTISTTVTLGNSADPFARLGFVIIRVCVGGPGCTGVPTPDIRLFGNWSDVVCKTAGSPAACVAAGDDYDPNPAAPYYTAGLSPGTNSNNTPPTGTPAICNPSPPNPAACVAGADMTATAEIPGSTSPAGKAIRITDHYNNIASTGDPVGCSGAGTCSGTVTDGPFPVPVVCAANGSAIGSYCGTNVTANALVPGVIVSGVNAVIRVGELRFLDAGPDGVRGNTDDQLAGVQGVYVP